MNSKKEEFFKNGFLILDSFNTPEECDKLIERARQLSESLKGQDQVSLFQTSNQSKASNDYFLASGDNISYFFENDAFDENDTLRQPAGNYLSRVGYALHDLDPVFDNFSHSEKLRQLATIDLELKDYIIIQSVYIFKHARIGGGLSLHQDSTFTYTEPDSCIGFWFALEDATIENGCLWAKPGGHHTSLRQRFYRKDDGTTGMEKLDTNPIPDNDLIPLEVKKGACIVLHGLLPHYSLHNTSKHSRQAYAIHAINSKAVYPENNWLQRKKIPLRGF